MTVFEEAYIYNMNIDYLIIGQGISGTFLCHDLLKKGQSFLVIDELQTATASRIASGIINPVTGRRIVKTWMIDELMPVAWNAYKAIGDRVGINCISKIDNIDFFPTPQMRLAFLERIQEDSQYLSIPDDHNDWLQSFSYDFGYGIISPCWLIDLQLLLPTFRKYLLEKNLLREQHFEADLLIVAPDEIRYEDITARKIIFCDGISGTNNRWFKNLPFAPNKGEVLIIEAPGLAPANIYKRGISVVPWKEDRFWVGSSHEWQFANAEPSTLFREKTEAQLRSFLKVPFKVVDHWAAVRPATLERRPFIGIHPQYSSVGIFNGMGTKGCSLAPYFASQLSSTLTGEGNLLPEVNVDRFKKVLARG